MSNSDIPVKEIGELMDVMSDKLPGLIREIYDILYSEEGAATMSKAVATFYKNLMEAGMEKTDAMRLSCTPIKYENHPVKIAGSVMIINHHHTSEILASV